MKLSFKSLIYFGILLVLIGSGLVFVKVNQENLLKTTFFERVKQQKALFNKVFELSESRISAMAKDYTFGDKLVDFVRLENPSFASENLDTSLTTYGASNIWIYNQDNQLVYSVGVRKDQQVKDVEIPLNPLARDKLFEKNRFVHFFVRTKEGVLDVFGATIHPSNDAERKTAPKGFFYVGKNLDSKALSELSQITNSKTSIESVQAKNPTSDKTDQRQGKLTFYHGLVGYDGNLVAQIKNETEFQASKDFSISSDRDFLIYFVFGLGFLMSFVLVVYLQDRSVEQAMRIAEVMTVNLTESEARFRAMNDASPFGIFVTDPFGKCIYTNLAYQKTTNQSSEESWGDGWMEIVHPEDRQKVYVQWYQAVSAGGEFSSEHRLKQKNDKVIWVLVKADAIRVEDKLLGYIGVVQDTTETKKLTKRTKQNEK